MGEEKPLEPCYTVLFAEQPVASTQRHSVVDITVENKVTSII